MASSVTVGEKDFSGDQNIFWWLHFDGFLQTISLCKTAKEHKLPIKQTSKQTINYIEDPNKNSITWIALVEIRTFSDGSISMAFLGPSHSLLSCSKDGPSDVCHAAVASETVACKNNGFSILEFYVFWIW